MKKQCSEEFFLKEEKLHFYLEYSTNSMVGRKLTALFKEPKMFKKD